MDHVAVDVGGRESQICRRSADGSILDERRVKTSMLGDYFAQLQPSRVILETCAEGFSIADRARHCGHDARVVPATLAPQLGVGARRLKSDKRDSRALSAVSCKIDLPSVHVPSAASRERHTLIGMRSGLVSSRTSLVNSVKGFLRGQVFKLTLKSRPEQLPEGVRRLFANEDRPLPLFLQRQLVAIETLTKLIREADSELEKLAGTDADCCLLTTAPGVGPVISVLFAAVVDDHSRFERPRDFGSYVGLTPGERSSSDTTHRLSITKAGHRQLRWLLVQAAWCAQIHYKDDPLVRWARQVALRRGAAIATVALARRLSVVMLAMLRDRTTYDPTRFERASMA